VSVIGLAAVDSIHKLYRIEWNRIIVITIIIYTYTIYKADIYNCIEYECRYTFFSRLIVVGVVTRTKSLLCKWHKLIFLYAYVCVCFFLSSYLLYN
jgi:hypothetical protein